MGVLIVSIPPVTHVIFSLLVLKRLAQLLLLLLLPLFSLLVY